MQTYIGTYTQILPHVHGSATGVYLYQVDPETGVMQLIGSAEGLTNPSYLALHPNGRIIYAVEEVDQGSVAALAIDPTTQSFHLLNRQPTNGAHPCYASIDASGQWLLVTNYSGGNVSIFPIAPDGSLGAPTDTVAHTGVATHHDGPHPHMIIAAPGGWVVVSDCGLDRIVIYRIDETNGKLLPNSPAWVSLAPGAGPRHLVFHPHGRLLYSINERNSTLTALHYQPDAGLLEPFQTLSTLPGDYTGPNTCADLRIHPSGQFLYGSNRGHDSIAIFAIDPASGALTLLGHESTQGRTPRSIGIDPTGTLLLAANQDSNSIVAFRIDPVSGLLTATGVVNQVPSPVCVLFP